MKLINDTIYKHIECSDIEDTILQTKIVNRLLFITQNALAYFAYPSINTKRYIHSLGTMHMVAHMFKNSILNANEETKNHFLKDLKSSIENLLSENKINLSLKTTENFEDKALFEFMVPLKSDTSKSIYFITLQALRLAGLLHDLGHFPFSHQVEYAMENIYQMLKIKGNLSDEERKFLEFYEQTTHNGKEVLHEAIGYKLIKLLFTYELNCHNNDYIHLLFQIIKNILDEKKDNFFDYKVLHSFIDGTIDADRLDYINRDMLASGYIGGAVDFIRIAKQSVLIEHKDTFILSFFDSEIIDIEHMLEMRFNLYKKIIFNHKITATDTHLENVVLYLAKSYFIKNKVCELTDSISMLWKFLEEQDLEKRLDIITQLDENWLITLFKKEYFTIKNKPTKDLQDIKYLKSFEEVLFGKRFYNATWKNLNELYNILEFDEIQRYKFRESFGYVSPHTYNKLKQKLENFCIKYEREDRFFTFQIVSLSIGIETNFLLFDGEKPIKIDVISTIRKRLKKSILNTVPFYLYSNKTILENEMIEDIRRILSECF
jgi:HD superfamily phosphohydrolase